MKLKNMLKKVMLGCVNAMAMMLVVQTANSACVWIVHQPEFPEVAKRYSCLLYTSPSPRDCS